MLAVCQRCLGSLKRPLPRSEVGDTPACQVVQQQDLLLTPVVQQILEACRELSQLSLHRVADRAGRSRAGYRPPAAVVLPAAAAPAEAVGAGAEVGVGENSAWMPCAADSTGMHMSFESLHAIRIPCVMTPWQHRGASKNSPASSADDSAFRTCIDTQLRISERWCERSHRVCLPLTPA